MAFTHYDIGDAIPLRGSFKDENGAPADPDDVTLRLQLPDGTTSTETYPGNIIKEGTGEYVFVVVPEDAGYLTYRYEGSGAVHVSEETTVIIDPSEFTSDAGLEAYALVTLPEAKHFLDVPDTEDDLQIARIINAASAEFLLTAGRELIRTISQTRVFSLVSRGVYTYDVWIGDAATVTAVETRDGTGSLYETVDIADVVSYPTVRFPWEPIRRLTVTGSVPSGYAVAVTAEYGFPSVPPNVKQAVLETVEAWFGKDIERRSDIFGEEGGDVFTPTPGADARSLPRRAYDVATALRDPVIA